MSTSKLQREVSSFLNTHFAQYHIVENYRPDWLSTVNGGRLELDFYLEDLGLAIEVQGEQHYRFVPHFHRDADGYKFRLQADRDKRNICRERNIHLHEIAGESDIQELLIYLPKPAEQMALPIKVELTKAEIIERDDHDEAIKTEERNSKRKQALDSRPDTRALNAYLEIKSILADAIKCGDDETVSELRKEIVEAKAKLNKEQSKRTTERNKHYSDLVVATKRRAAKLASGKLGYTAEVHKRKSKLNMT